VNVLSSFWTSVVLALVIVAIALVRGQFTPRVWLALLGYLVLAALFPPAGFLIGGIVVVYLLLVHGRQSFGQLITLFGGRP